MSVQAMAWAIEQRIARSPTQRLVLICLSNYADKSGGSAFPAVATLVEDTCLSRRAVQGALRDLLRLKLIEKLDNRVPVAYIGRADRAPTCYRIRIERGAPAAPREESTGRTTCANGAQLVHERGAPAAPNPSYNRQGTRQTPPAVAVGARRAAVPTTSGDSEKRATRAGKTKCVRCAEHAATTQHNGHGYCENCAEIVVASRSSSDGARPLSALLPKLRAA